MKQPLPGKYPCIAIFCFKHHNWLQPVIIACNWQWQHCILQSTKGRYKAIIIIIRFFENILPTTSVNDLKINAICWGALVESNFYPDACQKCNFHQGWFLDGNFETGVSFIAFKCRLQDLMNINEERVSKFIVRSQQ